MPSFFGKLLSSKRDELVGPRMTLSVKIMEVRRIDTDIPKAKYYFGVKIGEYSSWKGDRGMEKFETKPVEAPTDTPEGAIVVLDINEIFQRDIATEDVDKFQVRIKLQRETKWKIECIGFVAVRLSALLSGNAVDRWWPLRAPEEEAPTGEVRLQLCMLHEELFQERFPDGLTNPIIMPKHLPEHPVTNTCCCYDCDPNFIASFDDAQFDLKKIVKVVADELKD